MNALPRAGARLAGGGGRRGAAGGRSIVFPFAGFPDRIAGGLYVPPPEPPTRPTPEEAAGAEASRQVSLRRQLAILREFHKGLPKVQRVLANAPTYMIFDDHDVTVCSPALPTCRRSCWWRRSPATATTVIPIDLPVGSLAESRSLVTDTSACAPC